MGKKKATVLYDKTATKVGDGPVIIETTYPTDDKPIPPPVMPKIRVTFIF